MSVRNSFTASLLKNVVLQRLAEIVSFRRPDQRDQVACADTFRLFGSLATMVMI